MTLKQPPCVDGICSFVDNSPTCMAVQTKLDSLRTAFVATDDQPVCDTFYITATYNRTIAGTPIDATTNYPLVNGDTVEHCLALFDAPMGNVSPGV